ncbi:MAG: hypothetical protein ACYCZX_20690 [Rhodospirillaceae bacterium]
MTAFATRKDFDAWSRHRLAEMDAGLAAMEAEMATARDGVIAASRAAMEEARAWRDRFAKCIDLAAHGAEAQLKDLAPVLREAWVHFETEMENWAVAAEQKNHAFDARASALLSVWHAAAAGYKAQALTAAESERQRIQAAIDHLERDALTYGERFENLQDAGKLSWIAMGEALKESRAAFERANAAARAAFGGTDTSDA